MSTPAPDTVVFLGPTLPVAHAKRILDARYLPPAGKGDIYRLLTQGVRAILLIDGIFHNRPSVWHREILAAIDEGIVVAGASSMGALRAAELDRFGMRGSGAVYEWYRDGVINADDEVALVHAPAEQGFAALSEPLVNMRYTLQMSVERGLLSRDEQLELIADLRARYYPQRSYAELIACVRARGFAPARIAALEQLVAASAVDIKARDAADLLRAFADAPIAAASGAVRDPWNDEFRHINLARRVFTPSSTPREWASLRSTAATLPLWGPARAATVARWYLADLVRLRGLACPADYIDREDRRWRADARVSELPAQLLRRGLTMREYRDQLERRALVTWLAERGAAALGIAIDTDADVLDRELPRSAVSGVPVAQRPFVLAWARDSGIDVPRARQQRYLDDWRVHTRARRRKLAAALGRSETETARALKRRMLVDWVMTNGPHPFGRAFDIERDVVQDLQMSLSPDQIEALVRGEPA